MTVNYSEVTEKQITPERLPTAHFQALTRSKNSIQRVCKCPLNTEFGLFKLNAKRCNFRYKIKRACR